MKHIIPILSFLWLFNACASQVEVPSESVVSNPATCPQSTTIYLSLPLNTEESFYDRFDFHTRNIEADANTIKFQTLDHDFVFCRANNTWTVQKGTIKSELLPVKDYKELTQELTDPSYKNINFQGKNYQYRVILEPNFFVGKNGVLTRKNVAPESNKVIFQLLAPNSKEPLQQTLYTLKDLQQQVMKRGYSGLGVQLGPPRITSAIIHDQHLWWSIAFEQGEGNSGIATIVGYNLQTNKFTVLQPPEIESQQITDLAITGSANNPTFWVGTKISAEGTANIPANGLVAYRPHLQNSNSSLTSYTVHNSPIVGAIPNKLRLENDTLWVGTGNGVCQLKWQAADRPESWSCWRFALMAQLPSEEVPLYSELMSKTPAAKLSPNKAGDVEVLWWSPLNYETNKGRFEVRYSQGFTVTLDRGAKLEEFRRFLPPGKPPVEWAGSEWHWEGNSFVRGFDQVVVDLLGVGPTGIGSIRVEPNARPNMNAIRGDLELLSLTENSTSVKYDSGWVDENLLNPYLTVVPQARPQNLQPNPIEAIAAQLESG